MLDEIPLVFVLPRGTSLGLIIWLPGFGGNKEGVTAYLHDLAADGFAALALDPREHGARATLSGPELRERVLGNIRRHFWPILAGTAEDIPRVVDWAASELGVAGAIGIGGISMGGDIAVAAAGLDPRIEAVAAGIATADWLRPGSFEPPGAPDDFAQQCYRRRNPLTNPSGFLRELAITFQCGVQDKQVPPQGGETFVALLNQLDPGRRDLREVVLHEGVGHEFTPVMWERSRAWLRKHLHPGPAARETGS